MLASVENGPLSSAVPRKKNMDDLVDYIIGASLVLALVKFYSDSPLFVYFIFFKIKILLQKIST